jgi:hypothetical protein
MYAPSLLTRDAFREGVFKRDNHRCVICGARALDAHHIIERRLFADGGYYLDNGASVCEEHHLLCEMTVLTVDQVREACGIRRIVVPQHLYPDQAYDKWGNPVLANNESGVSANDFLNPATGQAFVDGNTPITGMLSFAAGQSTARFTVEAMHDATPEADERFSVQVAVTELGGVPLVAQPQQIDTVVGLITHDEVLPVNFDPAIDQQVHQPLPTLH